MSCPGDRCSRSSTNCVCCWFVGKLTTIHYGHVGSFPIFSFFTTPEMPFPMLWCFGALHVNCQSLKQCDPSLQCCCCCFFSSVLLFSLFFFFFFFFDCCCCVPFFFSSYYLLCLVLLLRFKQHTTSSSIYLLLLSCIIIIFLLSSSSLLLHIFFIILLSCIVVSCRLNCHASEIQLRFPLHLAGSDCGRRR